MDNKKFNIKNIIIVILAIVIIVLLLNNNANVKTKKTTHIKKGVLQKISNVKAPSVSPVTTMKTIINDYQNCINNNKCPITTTFRKTAQSYVKNGGKLNPITRLSSNFSNPQYHIITELATISILEVYNSNGSNKIEFNFLNKNGVWKLNSSNCFNSPSAEISSKNIPSCQ